MASSRPVLHIDEVEKIYNPTESQMRLHSMRLSSIRGGDEKKLGSKLDPILEVLEHLTENVVQLPHSVSHSWHHLICLIFCLALLSFGSHIIFLLFPFASVNEGYEANKDFDTYILTYYQFIALLPWVETPKYAIPDNRSITFRARIAAMIVGMLVQKLVGAAIVNDFWRPEAEKIFPIPFSIITTGTIAGPFAVLTLFIMSGDRDELFVAKFKLCLFVLLKYVVSLFISGLWAVLFTYVMGHWTQNLLALLYALLRCFCKIILFQEKITRLNSRRWVNLNFVVDIIFSRVQVATLPFTQSPVTFIAMVLSDFAAMTWKMYNGNDRVAVLGRSYWDCIRGKRRKVETLKQILGDDPVKIAAAMIRAPHMDVHNISIRLNAESNKDYSKWEEDEVSSRNGAEPLCSNNDGEKNNRISQSENSSCCIIEDLGEILSECSDFDLESGLIDKNRQLHQKYSCRPSLEQCSISTTSSLSLCSTVGSVITVDLDEKHEDLVKDASVTSEAESESCSSSGSSIRSHEPQKDTWLGPLKAFASKVELTMSQRRHAFKESKEKQDSFHEQLKEITWEQRHLFHLVDIIGTEIIVLIVEAHHLLGLILLRQFPVNGSLNITFQINDEQLKRALIYGWCLVCFNIAMIFVMALRLRFFQHPEGRRITLNNIVSYIFRNNYWFLVLWLSATGAFVCVAMVQHFGADFSLRFEWIKCRGANAMAWPDCL